MPTIQGKPSLQQRAGKGERRCSHRTLWQFRKEKGDLFAAVSEEVIGSGSQAEEHAFWKTPKELGLRPTYPQCFPAGSLQAEHGKHHPQVCSGPTTKESKLRPYTVCKTLASNARL